MVYFEPRKLRNDDDRTRVRICVYTINSLENCRFKWSFIYFIRYFFLFFFFSVDSTKENTNFDPTKTVYTHT